MFKRRRPKKAKKWSIYFNYNKYYYWILKHYNNNRISIYDWIQNDEKTRQFKISLKNKFIIF